MLALDPQQACTWGNPDPTLTIAVCTHNRPHLLNGLLSALLPQLAALRIRAIVVDSASTPPASLHPDHIARYGDLVMLIRLDAAGISRARNAALHACTTPWIGYIDDDELPSADWAHEALQLVKRLPARCAACSGNVAPRWPDARPSAVGQRWLAYLSMLHREGEFDQKRKTRFGVGHSVIRRDALLAAGEFDTSLGRDGASLLSGEESHLVEVLLRCGWQIWHSDTIQVDHVVEAARLERSWARERAYWEGISIMRRARLGDFAWPWWIVASSYLKVLLLGAVVSYINERTEIDLVLAYAQGVLHGHTGIAAVSESGRAAAPAPLRSVAEPSSLHQTAHPQASAPHRALKADRP
jgi:glycosyltransferase involved in cell wall biosynthesis